MTTQIQDQEQQQIKNLKTMLQIAQEIGCQLQPDPHNPDVVEGICPFHKQNESNNQHYTANLNIDTVTKRFYCNACNAAGHPVAFLAMYWGMSTKDAFEILNNNEKVTAVRPDFPDIYNVPTNIPTEIGKPLNSAVLTRATRFYSSQIKKNFPILQFLAKLEISPQRAEVLGIGFSPGGGLREHLESYVQNGELKQKEIDTSPLFHNITEMELFSNRITIPDRDFTRATLWMTSALPEVNMNLSREKPRTYGLPGIRPYVTNIYCISARQRRTVLTDDIRLYLLLLANDHPATLISHRQRNEPSQQSAQCSRIARILVQRGATQLSLAIHDDIYRKALKTVLLDQLNHTQASNPHVIDFGKEDMIEAIRNKDQYLKELLKFPENLHQNDGDAPQGDAPTQKEPENDLSPEAGQSRPTEPTTQPEAPDQTAAAEAG